MVYDPDINRDQDPIIDVTAGDHVPGGLVFNSRFEPVQPRQHSLFRFVPPPGWGPFFVNRDPGTPFNIGEGEVEGVSLTPEYLDKVAVPGKTYDILFDDGSRVQFEVLHKFGTPSSPPHRQDIIIRVTNTNNRNFIEGGNNFNQNAVNGILDISPHYDPTDEANWDRMDNEPLYPAVPIVNGVGRWQLSITDFYNLTAAHVLNRRLDKMGARLVEIPKSLEKGSISQFLQKRRRRNSRKVSRSRRSRRRRKSTRYKIL